MFNNQTFSLKVKAVLIGSLTLFSLSFGQATFVGLHGQLKIQGNKVVDKNNQPIILHGMSMYAWAQQGLQYYNATAVKRLVDEWKCTVIRIPILPGSTSSQTSLVRTVVDACIANGVYAIIDWHSMGGANASSCGSFMASMATSYGNTPNVMYEPWNEPVSENWATIKAYMISVIAAIRAVDPDNIIWCGNPQWDQRPDQATADPITTSTNIGYTFHFYAATHRVSSMGNNVRNACKTQALFSTEYGTSEASGNGTIDVAETQRWWNLLDSLGVGCSNWSVSALGETSAAFNNGTSATAWTDANLKPSGVAVKAYIISKYQSVGVLPYGFNLTQHDMVQKVNFSNAGNGAGSVAIFTLNGTRVMGSIPSTGCYIIRNSGNGNVKGFNVIR
jgi:endoglucanase